MKLQRLLIIPKVRVAQELSYQLCDWIHDQVAGCGYQLNYYIVHYCSKYSCKYTGEVLIECYHTLVSYGRVIHML